MLRTLIVDDEPLAREGLRNLLADASEVTVVGECGDGATALEVIRRDRPDLVLLDVQMPELSGFEVLQQLGPDLPVIIFVTAHDAFALQAFEAHAVDYLLKPVAPARFRQALERARAQVAYDRTSEVSERVTALLETLASENRFPVRLPVKARGSVTFVRVAEIDWIGAAGNYVKLHVGRDRHLIRETLSNLERRLDPRVFVRIHRSTIVNVDRIQEVQPWVKGDHVVVLRDGQKLTLSRTYRDRLL